MSRNELCACGSGKRYKHCHGRTGVVPPLSPRLEALAAQRAGSLGRAEALYRRAIADDPSDVDSLHMLGVVQLERMRHGEALELLWQAAERTNWAIPVVRHNLGLVLAKLMSPRANARQEVLLQAYVAHERARRATPALAPRVSVVLPVHDEADVIVRAIESVAEQTYVDLEVVVIDDGSIDGTAKVAADCLARLGIAGRLVERAHRGAAAAANEAATLATGSYLAFLDGADWFAPRRIERMVAEIARVGPQWGFSRVTVVDAEGGAIDPLENAVARPRNFLGVEPGSFTLIDLDATGASGNLFIERGLFHKLGGYREVPGHRGWDLCVRAGAMAEPVAVEESLYFHRLRRRARAPGADQSPPLTDEAMASALLSSALGDDATAVNELSPQFAGNRELLLRTEFRAGHGERVPIPVIRSLAAQWRARAADAETHDIAVPVEGLARKSALVVLGMHRSGTSALSRVFNLCGALLPERIMAAKLDVNPKGFWESEAVNDLDTRLLHHLGAEWNRVDFELPSDGPMVDEFLDDASRILNDEYGNAPFILIKDPRVCVLAPLWQRALSTTDYRPAYVVPVRNPLEVARSLEARGDMPVAEGLALWLAYMRRVEDFIAREDIDVFHVRYTDLLRDWRGVVTRVGRRFGLPLDTATHADQVDQFLETDLRNQQASDAELDAQLNGTRGAAIGELYRRALQRCDRDTAGDAASVEWSPSIDTQIGAPVASATFVLCIESNAIRDQALLHCESIRRFAGRHRHAPIFAYAPRPGLGVDQETQRMLRALDVDYIDEPLNTDCAAYAPANRVYAGAHAEAHASTDFVVVVDSDTVWLAEPQLPIDADVGVRPVDEKGSATSGPDDRFEAYWQQIADFCATPLVRLPWLRSTIGNERVRASYNAGLAIARRSTGVFRRTAELFSTSLAAGIRPYRDSGIDIVASTGSVGRQGSEYWGSSQAVLALAIWSATDRVLVYPDSYNLPLHLIALNGEVGRRWSLKPPVHVHYHGMFAARQHEIALDLMSRLGVSDDRIEWLRARIPFGRHELAYIREVSDDTGENHSAAR